MTDKCEQDALDACAKLRDILTDRFVGDEPPPRTERGSQDDLVVAGKHDGENALCDGGVGSVGRVTLKIQVIITELK